MNRRELITLTGGAAAWPLAAHAQQSGPMRRVGIVMPYDKGDPEFGARVRAFRQELEKFGWADGVNVQIDERWTSDNMDTIRAEAASLMKSNPDAVVTPGGRVIPILMRLSRSIPIVVPGVSDPIGVGYAKSLTRPEGNITGFSSFELSVLGKSLDLLKQIGAPITRVALIYNPDNPNTVFYKRAFETATGLLALEPIAVPIHTVGEIDHALASFVDRRSAGVLFPPDVTINRLREDIVALLAKYRLPAMYSDAIFPKMGGLVSYAADRLDLFRRSAGYVDRILRGEKPADLPFQQPTKFEFVLNLKTAKTLGLTIPPTLIAIADDVIE